MKINKVYVGANGSTLAMSSGERAVAAYPAQKGEKVSYFLLESGRIVHVNGARIQGVGVTRFISEKGFVLAEKDDIRAIRLADHLDSLDGRKLVEHAMQEQASVLQQHFAGQKCIFVPFAESKQAVEVQIEEPRGYVTVALNLQSGFSAGAVQIKPTSSLFSLSLDQGWLVGPKGTPSLMPRNTEYGGVVEHAVFVICNSGLASLVGAGNLQMNDNELQFPRGVIKMSRPNGDIIKVGINALDELEVQYCRLLAPSEVIYSRKGMPEITLGAVVGAIAAVFVRVDEMDALAQAKPKRVKKAA